MTITEALGAAIDAYRGRPTLCGAIRISRDGRVLFERAYGAASVQLSVPNTLENRFHIASMTKMFIAAAAVRLSQEGRLSLQDHPSVYVPELAKLDPGVTLHRLLCHMAGLADVYDLANLRGEISALVLRKGRLLDYLAALPSLHRPGQCWRYSSTGFLFLAYVLERVADAPFAQVMTDLFFSPLGLASTGADNPSLMNPGRATGQIATSTGWRNALNDGLAEIEGPREFYSTVGDLDRWATALQRGEILSQAGMALSFTPYATVGPGFDFDATLRYGYGWFLGDRFRWIGGMTDGFRSAMWQYPQEQLNVTMLWNNERTDSHGLFALLRPILLT
jgi:CubicO group peptidase (beta-lactamase class C family)